MKKVSNFKNFVSEETVEVNEKKVMDLDVLLNRFQDSDYSPSNSSLKDLENFIDFIREYTPKGTIIEQKMRRVRLYEEFVKRSPLVGILKTKYGHEIDKLHIFEDDDSIEFNQVVIRKQSRNIGIGSDILKTVT